LSRNADAIACYHRALVLRDDQPGIWVNLGNALADAGRLDEAHSAYRRALMLNPNFAEAWNNLGELFSTQNFHEDAIDACTKAIKLRPDYAEAHNNLANALRISGRTSEAVAHLRQALALDPNLAQAWTNLGNGLSDQGEIAEAESAYRRAVELNPNPQAHCNLLFHLLYCDYPPQLIFDEHRNFERLHARPLLPSAPHLINSPDPGRRLRIGYVSPDFRRHSVNYFVEPFLSHHDHTNFHIVCYADERWADATTERLRSYSDDWRDITAIDDAQLAEQIRADQIDILVDLAGHTVGNRLLALARKPAPIQITYLGYPATTGLSAIDYRLTDALADPVSGEENGMSSDTLHSEKLIRLPRSFLCYRIAEDLPPVSPLPALTKGHLTFGCFNNLAKLSRGTLDVWSHILRALSTARLVLKFRSLGDPDTRALVAQNLASHYIDPARVDLLPHTTTHAEHLALYSTIDIALDPFPYNGTTTTCEALAMGLPAITLAGQTHVSRVGVSILTNVGLTNLIAQSPDDYVRIALALASDLSGLTDLRSTLRQRMRGSPLCDEPTFTQNLESTYRTLWRSWCATQNAR